LLASLLVTPAKSVLGLPGIVVVRRMIGLAALAYGLLHLTLYAADENWRLLHVAAEIVFSVHVWNVQGDEPDTLAKVVSREKDLRYASRTAAHIERQRQIHKLRHVIAQLERLLPDDVRTRPETRALTTYGCVTRMHVVCLLAPPLYGETHSKDIDFTAFGIRQRWQSGYRDTVHVLQQVPWTGEFDPLEGFVLHEAASDTATMA